MRVGAPHDWPTFWDDYDNGKWEPETKAVLERFLGLGTLLIDIGAWIGPVAMWALDLEARVFAMEPDPVAYEALKINTHGRLRIRTARLALSDRIGAGLLANPHMGDSQSRLSNEGTPVTTVTTEWLFADLLRPSLIKLDIEGHELHVLPDLLALNAPTYISWHEPWWDIQVPDEIRRSWFANFTLEPIRGDGWTGFSELLAIPR